MRFTNIILAAAIGLSSICAATPTPVVDVAARAAAPAASGTIPASVINKLHQLRLSANAQITSLVQGEVALIRPILAGANSTLLAPIETAVNMTLASVVQTVTRAENMILAELLGVVVNATGPIPATVISDVEAVLAATSSNVQSLLQVELANVNSILGGGSALLKAVDGIIASVLNTITGFFVTVENQVVVILTGVTITV